jgi:integrase
VPPAMHCAIVCVDVERYADQRRTNQDQVAVRDALYRSLRAAFDGSGIRWDRCYHEDRGDGVLVLIPPEVPKNLLVARVPGELAAALAAHNGAHDAKTQIRLRMVVHAGEIVQDEHGVAATALNVAFRLLEAEPLKKALGGSAGMLAVIASQWFYDEVIRHDSVSTPASYRPARISVKETQATAWICLPDDPYPAREHAMLASMPPFVVPRQLPGAISGFAGRKAELNTLTEVLGKESRTGGTVVISAVDGTPGIGKTAIAVQWAHGAADRFPDGQLYVNLRGFDPSGPPIEPHEAVRGFLDAFEIPGERIPVGLDAQAALYRSLLADRRMLVVLDNARDSARPENLDPATIIALVRDEVERLAAPSARNLLSALRSFLRFLYVTGRTSQPLVAAVPAAAVWRGPQLPRAVPRPVAEDLLESCDQKTPGGRRDLAVLRLLLRLGLRAGEVAGLELDSIDWRAGEIVVEGKSRRPERLPLPVDVGEAIAAYLRDGRPRRTGRGCSSMRGRLTERSRATAYARSSTAPAIAAACPASVRTGSGTRSGPRRCEQEPPCPRWPSSFGTAASTRRKHTPRPATARWASSP